MKIQIGDMVQTNDIHDGTFHNHYEGEVTHITNVSCGPGRGSITLISFGMWKLNVQWIEKMEK